MSFPAAPAPSLDGSQGSPVRHPPSHGRVSESRDGATMDAEARRLVWRGRRGLKELDVLLERYVSVTLAGASEQQRRVLARLLELPDPELAGYLLGGRSPEAIAVSIVAEILAFQHGRLKAAAPSG